MKEEGKMSTWFELHNEAVELAKRAKIYARKNDAVLARMLYKRAEELEEQAFESIYAEREGRQSSTYVLDCRSKPSK